MDKISKKNLTRFRLTQKETPRVSIRNCIVHRRELLPRDKGRDIYFVIHRDLLKKKKVYDIYFSIWYCYIVNLETPLHLSWNLRWCIYIDTAVTNPYTNICLFFFVFIFLKGTINRDFLVPFFKYFSDNMDATKKVSLLRGA